MSKKSIYFHSKATHRLRQRETIDACPPEYRAISALSDDEGQSEVRIHSGYQSFFGRLKAFIARWCVPCNCRFISFRKSAGADIVYTWGVIPITYKRYVVEIDNPYCLSLYSLRWFRLSKGLIRFLLLRSRCLRIICISDACRENVRRELGELVYQKAVVVYPYIRAQLESRRIPNERISFLFVSRSFSIKGGRELLEAFDRLSAERDDVELTIVSDIDEDTKTRYAKNSKISFHKANIGKDELKERFFSKSDVFVLPTFQDSLGMVVLEAVSYGLPVISTRLYAIPELVEHEESGLLLDPPIRFYKEDHTAQRNHWNVDFKSIIESQRFIDFESELYHALSRMTDSDLRKRMGKAARELFLSRFSEDVRSKSFTNALKDDSC